MRRRESPPAAISFEDHGDDDCPVCVAERSGRQITADILTNPDPAFLSEAARRKLEKMTLGPGEAAELMATGSMMPDGSLKRSRWTVDAHGDIHCERDGRRVFVCNALTKSSARAGRDHGIS